MRKTVWALIGTLVLLFCSVQPAQAAETSGWVAWSSGAFCDFGLHADWSGPSQISYDAGFLCNQNMRFAQLSISIRDNTGYGTPTTSGFLSGVNSAYVSGTHQSAPGHVVVIQARVFLTSYYDGDTAIPGCIPEAAYGPSTTCTIPLTFLA